jgi:hypothetical protein
MMISANEKFVYKYTSLNFFQGYTYHLLMELIFICIQLNH